MVKRAQIAVLCAICGGFNFPSAQAQPKTPINSAGGAPKTVTISAPAYRLKLQSARQELDALKRKSPPRPIGNIIKKLDGSFDVRRADGQVQRTSGNFWSNSTRNLSASQNASRAEIERARNALQAQIRALDEWQRVPSYQHVDAQKIVADLESSGQIRVGPLWWQKALSDAWGSVVRAWDAFIKWLNGLFPRPATPNITAAPSDKWLWILFYGFVAALLSVILWFVWRAFGGKWSKRSPKISSDLQGEDADLLLLPPEELLSRAQQFAAAGNFREALRHRYLSLLLDLDARGVWRYDARRTNWEHIANLRRGSFSRELISPLSALTRRFDRVRYGGAPCDDEGWRRFDAEAREFETSASEPAKRSAEVMR